MDLCSCVAVELCSLIGVVQKSNVAPVVRGGAARTVFNANVMGLFAPNVPIISVSLTETLIQGNDALSLRTYASTNVIFSLGVPLAHV